MAAGVSINLQNHFDHVTVDSGGHLSAAFHHRQMACAVIGRLVEMVLQVDGHSIRHHWGDERRLQLPCIGFA